MDINFNMRNIFYAVRDIINRVQFLKFSDTNYKSFKVSFFKL